MNKIKHYLVLGAMLSAFGSKYPFHTGGFPPSNEKKNDLPLWDIDGSKIYAKDEKTAIKYAKKRGLYKDGIIKRIEL